MPKSSTAISSANFAEGFNYKTSAEDRIIRLCQSGDQLAFEELYGRYYGKVTSIILHILYKPLFIRDTDDIRQQVFLKLYLSISRFEFRSSLLTWIREITINECLDFLRKRKVRKLTYESDLVDVSGLKALPILELRSPESIDLAFENKDFIWALLSQVPENDRALLVLKEVDGYKVEELAGMTGLCENTIKVKLFRAKQKMIKAANCKKLRCRATAC